MAGGDRRGHLRHRREDGPASDRRVGQHHPRFRARQAKISKSDLVCLLTELRAPADLRGDLEQLRLQANRATGQWATYAGMIDIVRDLGGPALPEDDSVALIAAIVKEIRKRRS